MLKIVYNVELLQANGLTLYRAPIEILGNSKYPCSMFF